MVPGDRTTVPPRDDVGVIRTSRVAFSGREATNPWGGWPLGIAAPRHKGREAPYFSRVLAVALNVVPLRPWCANSKTCVTRVTPRGTETIHLRIVAWIK
jgi:hypothetical protein